MRRKKEKPRYPVYFHTLESKARTDRYISLWKKYYGLRGLTVEQQHSAHAKTLKASGPPGDYRLCAVFTTQDAANRFLASLQDGVWPHRELPDCGKIEPRAALAA